MLVREIPQWESTDKEDIYEWQTGNAQFKKKSIVHVWRTMPHRCKTGLTNTLKQKFFEPL